MAGFLFFQDPGITGTPTSSSPPISRQNCSARSTCRATLKIDVIGLVAAQSAYTVVVANRLDIRGAHLVINSDYGATDVPVPAGVGPTSGNVALSE